MFHKLKKVIRDYFSFTKKETNGFLILFSCLLFFTFSPLLFPLVSFKSKDTSFIESDRRQLDSLVALLETRKKEKQVSSTIAVKQITDSKKQESISLKLNSATAKQLQQINGIGEKLGARVVKFREALGGFYSKKQLYKVYGLDSMVVEKILRQSTKLDISKIKRININTASFKEINRHPYISYEQTKALFKVFRNKEKQVVSLDELVTRGIVDKEKLLELKNYLILE